MIRVFHARKPPPSCRNLVKTRGGFPGYPPEKFSKIGTPFWPFSLANRPFWRSKIVKIFRLRRAFPLRNRCFRGPKSSKFSRLRRYSPLKSPKLGSRLWPKIWRSQNLSSRKQGGGVPGMKYPDRADVFKHF